MRPAGGELRLPMSALAWILMAVVTLIWIGIFGGVAYLASSRLARR